MSKINKTFVAGEMLKAEHLNAIKSAVNDNDEKLSELEGQSLSVKEVKTNGNIVLKDGNGNEKEYMSATPSGDPMHYAYVTSGAVWNETTGYWELNGLSDITNEQMNSIFSKTSGRVGNFCLGKYANITNCRTNIDPKLYAANVSAMSIALSSSFETIVLTNLKVDSINYGFDGCNKLKQIIGEIDLCYVTNTTNSFRNCKSLVSCNIKRLGHDLSFAQSVNLDANSVAYMIRNAHQSNIIAITLHATAYARAMADASVQSALATKTNVTLVSA